MKLTRRILAVIVILLVLTMAGGTLYLNHLRMRAIPDYNAEMDLERLSQPVTVFRDSFGVPHIYAESQTDLYRTVGYVMSQDRLWQMDLMRRITTGRLSEVLDPGLVDADQLFRALDFSGKSERLISRTDPKAIECIEAFTDGVNQYIERHLHILPFEFAMLGYRPEPWTLLHTFNMIGYMSWDLSSGWGPEFALYKLQQVLPDTLFKELLPNLGLHDTPVFPDFMTGSDDLEMQSFADQGIEFIREKGLEVFTGSNNWAISGDRSETGFPLMSNDMHLGLMAPGIWYQMHQVVEEELDVTGVTLPGAPFVICGHNRDIAWGMTNVTVDDLDFYLETIHPSDSNRYLLDGEWKEMKLVEEVIDVKGRNEPVVRINRYTHRGPVISRFRGVSDKVLSIAWQGNGQSNELRTVYLLNRASGWEEFREAVRTFTSISQNIVYADRHGNIGLQTAAGIPIRRGGGILVYPGDTSLYDWQGTVPFEELPYSFNPEKGFVASANNRTAGDEYPYYIGSWFSLSERAGRIREMILKEPVVGIDDFRRMLRDHQSVLARNWTPIFVEALQDRTEGIYRQALGYLGKWDHVLDVSSPAATIFEMMRFQILKAVLFDELGETNFPLIYQNSIIAENLFNRIRMTGGSAWCDNIHTPDSQESFRENIREAFSTTVDTLVTLLGDDISQWEWGKVHTVSFMHPLGGVSVVERLFKVNRTGYSVGGSSHTVCPYSYPLGISFVADHGASERHIFDASDWDRSLTVIPTGTSGIPASIHYMDQTGLYVDNGYHTDPFSKKAVEEHAMYKGVFR